MNLRYIVILKTRQQETTIDDGIMIDSSRFHI
jgi:hypothetical protein